MTCRRMIAKVRSPSAVDCAPSAMVRGTGIVTICPSRNERWPSLPASGSTPKTRQPGEQRSGGQRAARELAAAAEAGHQHVEGARLLDQFLRERPLPGDDVADG